ncbi:MAG TPA: hypothetical protein PKY63_08895 [Bacteroidales bacterium]|nr:hypothetical protein [Bacteroidales bacterium]
MNSSGYYYFTPEFTPQDAEEYLVELRVKRDKSQLFICLRRFITHFLIFAS